jgi:hypothetical protein
MVRHTHAQLHRGLDQMSWTRIRRVRALRPQPSLVPDYGISHFKADDSKIAAVPPVSGCHSRSAGENHAMLTKDELKEWMRQGVVFSLQKGAVAPLRGLDLPDRRLDGRIAEKSSSLGRGAIPAMRTLAARPYPTFLRLIEIADQLVTFAGIAYPGNRAHPTFGWAGVKLGFGSWVHRDLIDRPGFNLAEAQWQRAVVPVAVRHNPAPVAAGRSRGRPAPAAPYRLHPVMRQLRCVTV